jgi:hypothetical protein
VAYLHGGMRSEPNAIAAPPVEIVLSETVQTLAFAAHAYLTPAEGEALETHALDSASIALDLAGTAFERIQSRLAPDERSALARLLTDLRLTYVKKRGL